MTYVAFVFKRTLGAGLEKGVLRCLPWEVALCYHLAARIDRPLDAFSSVIRIFWRLFFLLWCLQLVGRGRTFPFRTVGRSPGSKVSLTSLVYTSQPVKGVVQHAHLRSADHSLDALT